MQSPQNGGKLPGEPTLAIERQPCVEIIDLTETHESLYCMCLEDWSDEIKEAGDHKQCWLGKMRDRGLRVKLALDDHGQVGGDIVVNDV